MRFAADFLPVMITVDNWTERTLTPLTLVRIQVRHDFESVEAAILAAEKNEAARVYCRLILAADLDAVERKRLIKLASKRSGAGVGIPE